MHLDDIHGVDPDLAYWMQLRMVEEHKQMGAPFTDEEMAEMREGGDIILGKCPNCSVRPVGDLRGKAWGGPLKCWAGLIALSRIHRRVARARARCALFLSFAAVD